MTHIGDYTETTAVGAHGSDHCPLVRFRVITLACLEALFTIKSTTNVNLGRGQQKFKLFFFCSDIMKSIPLKNAFSLTIKHSSWQNYLDYLSL